MPDQTIVHSSGLRGGPPQHVHGATTVGKRFVTHRRMRSPDAVKIVRVRSPAVDRPARVASGSARDPDGRRRGRGTVVTRVIPGTWGKPGDSSRRPVDRSPSEGRSEAAVTTSGGSVIDLGRGRPRARRGPSHAGGGRSPAGRASRSCASAGSGRGEHDRRPVGGAADRPEPVGADDPGAMCPGCGPRGRQRPVCVGSGHGWSGAWSRTAGVGPAHDAHPRTGGVQRPVRGRSLGGAGSCRSGWGPGQDTRPRRKPWATACARSRTPSLRNSRRAWVFTVSSDR